MSSFDGGAFEVGGREQDDSIGDREQRKREGNNMKKAMSARRPVFI
jgi:hypothetical protein